MTFHDAIDEALGHEEELASLASARPDRPSAILDMPEMLAIKATLAELFVDEFHDRDQIIGGMKAWGYSDELCEWVLS